MNDPQDRRMADLFEMELRHKAELDPGNEWELVWFLGLPLETRCSYMRILEARIDQDARRQFLFRQSCYRQRNWRQPTTACMHIGVSQEPMAYGWNSLNRRKRRKPARYRRRKHRATDTRPYQEAPPDPVDPDSEITDVVLQAQGYNPMTGNQEYSYTPRTLTGPAEPIHYPPFTLYPPTDPIFVDGEPFDPIAAYLIAAGHHQRTPWEHYSFEDAALAIRDMNYLAPGFFDLLIDALFPDGLRDIRSAIHVNQYAEAHIQFPTDVQRKNLGGALYASAMTLLIANPDAPHAAWHLESVLNIIRQHHLLDEEPILGTLLRFLPYTRVDGKPIPEIHTLLRNEITRLRTSSTADVKKRRKEKYWVGMIFKHTWLDVLGLIIGWDEACKADEEVIIAAEIDELPRGRGQPFYKVLDTDGNLTYLAEDQMVQPPSLIAVFEREQTAAWDIVRALMQHRMSIIEPVFTRVEVSEELGRIWFVPSASAAEEYPDDTALGEEYMRKP
ncbi:hemimethylated DNA-binding domain protein [Ceratobasidium sp. AG-Ba]|nr:hemimethylated DNA-binding domain protein [Ceratobasidium sp. AG-Ba]